MMRKLISDLYRYLFVKKRFYKLNRYLFQLTLRGIGVLNFENSDLSGERWFLRKLIAYKSGNVILDVGANVGEYSNMIRDLDNSAEIYAFEPHPNTFKKLALCAKEKGYVPVNAALGNKEDRLTLFDYAETDGSAHASLYRAVIEDIHGARSRGMEVDVTTIDAFVQDKGIKKIGLLKIDTEGNEFQVLQGAKNAIKSGAIEVIHFEFNEMNVVSRIFMKDFFDFLQPYRFYRMLPDGLVEIEEYGAAISELFAYQNIVAVHRASNFNKII